MVNKIVTINIRKYLVKQPRTKRIRKAVSYVRVQAARHAKMSIENVKLSEELNEYIFKHAAREMTPLKLSIAIEANKAIVSPFKEQQTQASQTAEKKAKGKEKEKGGKESGKPTKA
ncbi:MAG: hypothetical protein ACP5K5_03695 [Candidatus Micrarchaeia archaeon]